MTASNFDCDLFSALAAMGAGDFAHLNGMLERHFVGVHDLLVSWDASEVLRRAGLFHAAYGTAGFEAAVVSLNQRIEIARLIGEEPEQIVYGYCACERNVVWPQIGIADPVIFKDRFTGTEHTMPVAELQNFCELTCANELEIALGSAKFTGEHGRGLLGLFRRWGPWLSPAATQAAERAFGEVGA